MSAPFAKKIYNSSQWKQCRDAYAASKNYICERCFRPGEEVHHKKHLTPKNVNDPEIVFGWDNLELLCRECHNLAHDKAKQLKKPAREGDLRVMFDESGRPAPRGAIRVVWGAPCAGKMAFVREHMQHMDVVVDLDRMTECFTMLDPKSADARLITDYLSFSLAIREAVYRFIANKLNETGVRTCWIVAGLPRKRDRADLVARFSDAEFTRIECSIDEAIRRAQADDRIADKDRQTKIIEKYFRSFEA